MPSATLRGDPRRLLVVAPPAADRGELFAGLEARRDLRLLFAGVAEALRALGDRTLSLLITAPEVAAPEVSALLAARERLRPTLPVLVIRDRRPEVPAGWEGRGVGVLRRPLLPGALVRSVDVVLGLSARGS